MTRSNERSPIKDRPLRQAGQSLEEERAAIWDDKLEPTALMAVCFVAIAFVDWWRYWINVPPNPWLFSGVALVMLMFAAWRIRRYLPRLRAIRQGIEGEKVVGQFLERLRERGYHVFHDVVGPTFNVNHCVDRPRRHLHGRDEDLEQAEQRRCARDG